MAPKNENSQQVKDLEAALTRVMAERDELAQQVKALAEKVAKPAQAGGVCPSCAAKAAAEKEAAEKEAAEREADEKAKGKIQVAKERRQVVLGLREKNRNGVDPYKLDKERMEAEDKYNAELRKLNVTIQGTDPLA